MKTAIVGYPRIGSLRELKFWTEDYFKKNITKDVFKNHAGELRKNQRSFLSEKGIGFIPSNDFSFYDTMLDTACLFNIIPDRYKRLDLDDLDTCFAMARGYQGENGDVKALPMKKWFNTNYHYIVPEFEDTADIKLIGRKPFEEYKEALQQGIPTNPVLIGPFTLLRLSSYTGDFTAESFADSAASAYGEVFDGLNALGVGWLQLDEPYLVTDLTDADKALFLRIYDRLLSKKGALKILLQTYFGDIRDIYREVTQLAFDGIGLDFIEGKKTRELVEKNGFPKDKLLFAGVVNGKNIWRNNYRETVSLLERLTRLTDEDRLVISTSCSLLHVPYTLRNETGLPDAYKTHFAFAEEKLAELMDLKSLMENRLYRQEPAFVSNLQLFEKRNSLEDREVKAKVSALAEKDFTRLPGFEERERIQKIALKLPILPTTTIGSFPQTAEVKANRAKYRRGEITAAQYTDAVRKKIAECIALQDEIGLDVLVHGEYERNDMVEHFGENLSGFVFTAKAWVQSYGTRCVKPPIIWGDIKRSRSITTEYSKYAQSLTDKPVKGMLTGPVTILNWSFPREDITQREMAFQIGLAIREEVLELEANGIRIIQIDEAALKEKLPIRHEDWHKEYLDWAIPAFRLTHTGVKPETQIHTHMCYSEFRDIIRDIEDMDADVISFEASRSQLAIVDALRKSGFKPQVGPGVYDIHSPRIPGEDEIADAIRSMLADNRVRPEKLWINPDCGLKTRWEAETIPSLKNLVHAAQRVREQLVK